MNENQNPSTAEADHWGKVCLDYLEGGEKAPLPEFLQLLQDPRFCATLAGYSIDYGELQSLSSEDGDARVQDSPATIEAAFAAAVGVPCDAIGATPAKRSGVRRPAKAGASSGRWNAALLAGGLGVLAASLLAGLFVASRHWGDAPFRPHVARDADALDAADRGIQAVAWSGQVMVDGKKVGWDAGEEVWLRNGVVVATGGGSGLVSLRYADGTIVELASESTASFELRGGQKLVDVEAGFVSASVKPQPAGKPLKITTAEATIEVVGTELAISRVPSATTLSVSGGQVRMWRSTDGELVEVNAGEYAVASTPENGDRSPEYRAFDLDRCPDQWVEDFEDGLPSEWNSGSWVSQGLPDGSSGGVTASKSLDGDDFGVATGVDQEIWKRGLVSIHEDSVLNLRMKVSRDDFYHVLVFMRGRMHYEYQEPHRQRSDWTGKWRTLSIPLAAFKRTGREFEGGDDFEARDMTPPVLDRPIYMVMVSSQKRDLGLVIDRMWISRDPSVTEPTVTTDVE
ncbi:fec operon regulator FecR [Pirellulimonas nuda]|uniref:Fec operon regulator FecR n=1 Tax=Pirellulimonas nuda TaxID=2528009 RepID=A0A518DAR3_9BACT|nr:FecR family protein [Pirellulimonas nuda]QDU88562.1 fec operon regulator FecR [Pirellulimonas nuda]